MTVKELKEILSRYDESFPVFLGGVEGAWNLQRTYLTRVKKNQNPEWKNGPHELNTEDYDSEGVVIE